MKSLIISTLNDLFIFLSNNYCKIKHSKLLSRLVILQKIFYANHSMHNTSAVNLMKSYCLSDDVSIFAMAFIYLKYFSTSTIVKYIQLINLLCIIF